MGHDSHPPRVREREWPFQDSVIGEVRVAMRFQLRHLLLATTALALLLGVATISPGVGGIVALLAFSTLVSIVVPLLMYLTEGLVRRGTLTDDARSMIAGLWLSVVVLAIVTAVGGFMFWRAFGF